jgi:hypothetical protein
MNTAVRGSFILGIIRALWHLPPREQPEEFARVVEGFLSR